MRKWTSLFIATLASVTGEATEAVLEHHRYQAPKEFNGHPWGKPLSHFSDFNVEPASVQTAHSHGKVTSLDVQCIQTSAGGCHLERSLRTLRQEVEGDGFHALAEYHVESQGMRFPRSAVILFPVFYQFCANWGGFIGEVPEDIQQHLKLCGVRLLFKSESIEELHGQDDEYLTAYERLLSELIEIYGAPDNYGKRGRVTIETPIERISSARSRSLAEWRWCGSLEDRKIAPSCRVSIVLVFEPATGSGVLLYATRATWEFAFARRHSGAVDDPLYELLHGRKKRHQVDIGCTGTLLCRTMSAEQLPERLRAPFRLPTTQRHATLAPTN